VISLVGMPLRTDTFDLGGLRLTSGEARRLDLHVGIDPFELAGERYTVDPDVVAVEFDVSRTTRDGYALRLGFEATLSGPCMRCLADATPVFQVLGREISQPGAGDELESPYVQDGVVDLNAWARDALALTVPTQVLCRPACAGLCPICGADLNEAGPGHAHEQEPDPRWAKLSELHLD
jgi:uncharacterized protein